MKKSEDRIGESGENIGSVDVYVEQMDAMIAANDEFLKLADDLNSFYGHPKNRRPIDSQRVLVIIFFFRSKFYNGAQTLALSKKQCFV